MTLPEPDHVLHVEDDDIDAALIGELLKGRRYRVSRVRTYGEMLEFQGHPDVVLLDLRIPGSDDPIRLVQDAAHRFPGSGIILLTGIGDSEGEELSVRAMASGAQSRLLKQTFDRRRLHLAICEAYQQRKHLARIIEESRADMRIDPKSLRDIIRTVITEEDGVESNVQQMIQQMNEQIMCKLKKLGAGDTQPLDPVPHGDSVPDSRRIDDAIAYLKRHRSFIQWLLAMLAAGYFAAGDYVNGIRDAVFETRDRVKQIQQDIE